MKAFMLRLGESLVSALVILPATLVGVATAAWTYEEHVEPWLKENFKKKKDCKE